jgi:putative transposase
MLKSIKVRLFPSKEQEVLMWKHINGSRFVWNYGLSYQEEYYKKNKEDKDKSRYLSGYDLRKIFVSLKQQEEYKWLKEISSHTISRVCLDIDDNYRRFFKKTKGKPKFKKKNKAEPKFPIRQESLYFIEGKIVNIEILGKIKYQTDYNIPLGMKKYKFKNPRVKFINNKWILVFVVEFEKQEEILNNFNMGIDLGIKDLAIISYGDKVLKFKNINKTTKMKKIEKRLKRFQRKVSRKYIINNKKNKNNENYKKWQKSNNILKLEQKIRKLYFRLSSIRKNYTHHCTNNLVKLLPKKIVMENLDITAMMKNRCLSKALQEQCLYEFRRQMKYKAEWRGITFVLADKYYPSSKTCSCCGKIKKDLKLGDRVYRCNFCNLELDRDINASINLMNYKEVN